MHQDSLGARGGRVDPERPRPCGEVWRVRNADGGTAIVLFNRDDGDAAPCEMAVDLLSDAGLSSANTSYSVRDLWLHEELAPTVKGERTYGTNFSVNATSCKMLRFVPR